MSRLIDLTGQRFGRLTVIERAEDYIRPNGHTAVRWRCICDCGKEKITTAYSLTHGYCISCGCYRNENNLKLRGKNLIGEKYGRLTVLEYIGSNGAQSLWKCQCECGNIVNATTGDLRSGKKQSCGCLYIDNARKLGKAAKKYNIYVEDGEYYKGFSLVYPDKFFLIDKEDYDLVYPYCWQLTTDGYWKTTVFREDGTKFTLSLHQLIMETRGTEFLVDHINRNPSDNRKENLRIASFRQNSLNRTKQSINTSGIVGVEWSKTENKWHAKISKEKKKQRIIGRYDTKEEAIIARLKAEKEYYGEFAPQRNLWKEYGIEDD